MQKQLDDTFRPVFYFSKRTTEIESRYHSYELEMLAIASGIKRFHVYLQSLDFKIVTDCNSIKMALNKKELNPRINRWALILENEESPFYELRNGLVYRKTKGKKIKFHVPELMENNSYLQSSVGSYILQREV
jgi:hypothetical protein